MPTRPIGLRGRARRTIRRNGCRMGLPPVPNMARPRSSTSTQRPIWSVTAGTRRSLPGGETDFRTTLFAQSQASAFNASGDDLGAALPPGGLWRLPARQCQDARKALDLAYGDVAAAFDRFVEESRRTGRSSLPATARASLASAPLLKDEIAGQAGRKPGGRRLCRRLAGQPDRRPAGARACRLHDSDRQRLHLLMDELRRARQPRPGARRKYKDSAGFVGGKRKREDMICANPISGARRTAQLRPPTIPGRWCRTAIFRRRRSKRRPGRRALRQGPADDRRRGPGARTLSSCPATIITSTIMPCSGARSAATRRGGWRRGSRDHR